MSEFRLSILRAAHATVAGDAAETLSAEFGVDAAAWPGDAASMTADAFAAAAAAALASLPVEDLSEAVARVSHPGRYQNGMRFDLTPEAIEGLRGEVEERVRAAGDAVAAVPEGQHEWDNTVGALEDVSAALAALVSSIEFAQHVHPNEKVRDASAAADTALSAFHVEQSMRTDVYRSLLAFKARVDAGEAALEGAERRRALDFYLRDAARNGLHLADAERARVEAIKKELSALGIQFSKNLADDKTAVRFASAAELDGVPPDVLAGYERDGGDDAVLVKMDYPEYVPAMKYCRVAETRRRLELAYNTRCMKENAAIMERLVALRAELAAVLGFPTFAAYQLDTKMAKTPGAVASFLANISERLEPVAARDLEALLALKRAECEAAGAEFDGKINAWDYSYYVRLREETEFKVDGQLVQQYLPLQTVIDGTLRLYEGLFGIRFARAAGAHVWHDDVIYFDVTNTDGSPVGAIYFDLHPRENKYGHAACWGSVPRCEYRRARDGALAVQLPVTALVCNFTKPTADKPSLLTHNEAVTLLHELGHGLHGLLSEAALPRFAGTQVERDFVEAPSQMLEQFCWNATVLRMLSGHHSERGEDGEPARLPDELVASMLAAKTATSGLVFKRQLVFGTFDQRIHTRDSADVAEVFAATQGEVSGGIAATPGTCFPANFAHLAGGYEASYYGYAWAQSLSCAMYYDTFGEEGVLNAETGARYRREILAPGGSRDAMESVTAFIGHAPTDDAFLRELGL